MVKVDRALFIFRRDLRLEDNTALGAALLNSKEVIPAFVFDPRQTSPHPYRSIPARSFMLRSLKELDERLMRFGARLNIFKGLPHEVVERLIGEENIKEIYLNRDYTPFSRERDSLLEESCRKYNVKFLSFDDALLVSPESGVKKDGTPYTVFTPFFKHASQAVIKKPYLKEGFGGKFGIVKRASHWRDILDEMQPEPAELKAATGGRKVALEILGSLARFKNYARTRDYPAAENGTTGLSPHLKFGTVSIREAYYSVVKQLGVDHPLIRQFFWRDFFTHIAWHFPHVFSGPFQTEYAGINWENDERLFTAWKEGLTGFPIVDAGMREIKKTGFMHNRIRMVTASFLVKDLHINWQDGEKYFATHLVDYDPSVNNGNWQWAASTGCDAQPYFRVFNPWLQSAKFDLEGNYIKKWVPELSGVSAKALHRPRLLAIEKPSSYPDPVVEHEIRKAESLRMFESYKSP